MSSDKYHGYLTVHQREYLENRSNMFYNDAFSFKKGIYPKMIADQINGFKR